MPKKIVHLTIIFILTCLLISCASKSKENLSIIKNDTTFYQCENGESIKAVYYSLSDKSLEFVKLTLPDKKEYTLPRSISGSGARFTDDVEYVWWIKGDNAFLEARNQNGEWYVKFDNCKLR